MLPFSQCETFQNKRVWRNTKKCTKVWRIPELAIARHCDGLSSSYEFNWLRRKGNVFFCLFFCLFCGLHPIHHVCASAHNLKIISLNCTCKVCGGLEGSFSTFSDMATMAMQNLCLKIMESAQSINCISVPNKTFVHLITAFKHIESRKR
jgi:hypothetical protein